MQGQRKAFSGQLGDIDLRLMRVFRTVIQCGGLSAAEVELGVGKSTISRQISDLEQRLGLRLCHRGRKGFVLTQEGTAVMALMDEVLQATDHFTHKLSELGNRMVGQIQIGLIDYAGSDPLNPLMQALRDCHKSAPNLQINLTVGTPAQIERGVLEDRLHLGLIPDYHRIEGLQSQPLYREEVGLFCAADHPLALRLAQNHPLQVAEVLRHPLVYRGYGETDALRRLKQRFGMGSIADQTEAVLLLVQAGIYLGFLPRHCAKQLILNPFEILPETFSYDVLIHAIWRSGREKSGFLAHFLGHLLPNLPKG